ncbi:MAG: DNA replication/repair protein RecF [Paracoccaceae bacterium]
MTQACYVERLTLSHMRSYVSFDQEFDARPVAIYGANGSGKTNILEALSLLSPGRGLRRASSADIARRPTSIGWKVQARLWDGQRPREINLRTEPRQSRSIQIDSKAASSSALAQLAGFIWLTPAMDRLWIEGADGRRRFLDRITLSLYPEHAEQSLTYEKAMRERNRLLKEGMHDAHWYRALERQMAQAGAQIQAHRRAALDQISTAQSQVTGHFPQGDFDLFQGDTPYEETQDGLIQGLAQSRAMDLRAGRTLIGPHRADVTAIYRAKEMPAAECSTGEQKALLLSMVLANARALQRRDGRAPIMLFDEVAAHLDAGRRAALYDEVSATGAQAWLTGTGPELFEALGPRAQYLEMREENNISQIAAYRA